MYNRFNIKRDLAIFLTMDGNPKRCIVMKLRVTEQDERGQEEKGDGRRSGGMAG